MELWAGAKIADLISGLIFAKKQVHGLGVDLTLKEITKVKHSGELDFGGGEYRAATGDRLVPEKRTPEDEYGWWDLGQGNYLLRYNEEFELPEAACGIIFPHVRLLMGGGTHPPLFVSAGNKDQVAVLLQVGPQGLLLKENARISTLIVMA